MHILYIHRRSSWCRLGLGDVWRFLMECLSYQHGWLDARMRISGAKNQKQCQNHLSPASTITIIIDHHHHHHHHHYHLHHHHMFIVHVSYNDHRHHHCHRHHCHWPRPTVIVYHLNIPWYPIETQLGPCIIPKKLRFRRKEGFCRDELKALSECFKHHDEVQNIRWLGVKELGISTVSIGSKGASTSSQPHSI